MRKVMSFAAGKRIRHTVLSRRPVADLNCLVGRSESAAVQRYDRLGARRGAAKQSACSRRDGIIAEQRRVRAVSHR
jgi:hypothetical protein